MPLVVAFCGENGESWVVGGRRKKLEGWKCRVMKYILLALLNNQQSPTRRSMVILFSSTSPSSALLVAPERLPKVVRGDLGQLRAFGVALHP